MAKNGIKDSLNEVLTRIKIAAGKRSLELLQKEVKLIAVSKTKPKEMIIEAYEYGQRYFGENYVDELYKKSHDPEILDKCNQIKWHFIGHLQKKNINKLLEVKNLNLLETIDSQKLAIGLNKSLERSHGDRTINALLQVNTSGEEGKNGIQPSETSQLIQFINDECPRIKIIGLMTIASLEHSLNQSSKNPDFECLVDCKNKICDQFQLNKDDFELSMGMSNDFEQAILMGSTSVRVGSMIFGARNYK